jgi:hypothetical protein
MSEPIMPEGSFDDDVSSSITLIAFSSRALRVSRNRLSTWVRSEEESSSSPMRRTARSDSSTAARYAYARPAGVRVTSPLAWSRVRIVAMLVYA